MVLCYVFDYVDGMGGCIVEVWYEVVVFLNVVFVCLFVVGVELVVFEDEFLFLC